MQTNDVFIYIKKKTYILMILVNDIFAIKL